MSESGAEAANNLVVQDRQDLIETAVRFLNNPKVIPTPLESKKLFLSKKGLTESEINTAIQKSASSNSSLSQSIIQNQTEITASNAFTQNRQSGWSKILNLAKNLIIAGCVAYAGYKLLVKKFLKKKSNFELIKSSNEELKNSIDEMKQSINQLKDSIEAMSSSITSLGVQKQAIDETNVKSELKSIKSLLLSRQQFPSIPAVTPVIPSWQLETKTSGENSPEKNDDKKLEENSE